jgi:hypothetical protein
LRLGELEEAHQIFTKSLRQFNEVREQIGVVFTLEGFASLAVKRKQADRAARLFAFTARARMQLDNPRPFSEQADVRGIWLPFGK